MPSYKVFISHASEDSWVARQIERRVKDVGSDSFVDRYDIATGDQFKKTIRAAAKASDELLVLLTPAVLKESKFVWMEAGIFFGDEKRIIWVLSGVTAKQLNRDPRAADIIKDADIIGINELDRYFEELRTRVTAGGNTNA